jgi:hypothetical protein
MGLDTEFGILIDHNQHLQTLNRQTEQRITNNLGDILITVTVGWD